MSEIVDEIFERYNEVFVGRADDIKEFLSKHYIELLERRELLNVERIDATNRIKTSGFRTNLSSWRNTYQNVVISLGMEIEGQKKRFDYKFYFTEEKLSQEIVERIEEELKQINTLKKQFNFPEAINKTDELIDSIKKEKDIFYNRKLQEVRKEILKAEKDYNGKCEELEELEEIIGQNRASEDLEKALTNCDKLINLSKSIRNKGVENKYTQMVEEINETIAENKRIAEEKRLADEAEQKRLEEEKKLDDEKRLADEAEQKRLEEEKKLDEEKRLAEEAEQKQREQSELKEKVKEIENILKIEENTIPLIEEFSVDELLGDLSGDMNEILNQVGSLLNEHRVEVKEDISNSIMLTSASGEVIEQKKSIEVIKSDNKEEVSFNVQSGFDNPFDDMIEEAIISDLIPYNFEISNIELNGESVKELPDNSLTKEGIELKWEFKNIPPKESIEIKYDLRRRVSRTIIFMLQKQLKIIKTHSNLKDLQLEGLYEADLPFTNSYGTNLEGVVVEDIIPLYYVHFIKEPDKILPDKRDKSEMGELVKWNIGIMDPKTLDYNYRLLELYKFEELKISIDELDKKGFDALVDKDVSESIENYSKILNELMDYIR